MTKYTYGPWIAWNEGDTPPSGMLFVQFGDGKHMWENTFHSCSVDWNGPFVRCYRHATEVKPEVVTLYISKHSGEWCALNRKFDGDMAVATFELDENGQPVTSSIKMALIEDDDNE